jgi:hypothetical protein
LELALRLLADPANRLDLGMATRFEQLPERYSQLLDDPAASPLPLVAYGDSDV